LQNLKEYRKGLIIMSLCWRWKHENGRLFNDKGKFDDKKVFGAKVELFDKKTK